MFALAIFLLTSPLQAADVGTEVSFPSGRSFKVDVAPRFGETVFDSGESAPIDGAWDTVLFQGVSPDEGAEFEVAARSAQGVQSAWRPVEIRRFPGGRFWGKAVVEPGARTLRLRVKDLGVADAHPLDIFSVEVFSSAAVEEKGAPAEEKAAPEPAVHRRAEWLAKPPKRPYAKHSPNRLTYHHTDGHYTTTVQDSLAEVRFIQDFHMNGRGWDDIGYHFLIDAAGNVFEGRPENVIGAHTENQNTDNVGIAFLGMYHAPRHDSIMPAALAAFLRVGRYLVGRYKIDPNSLKGHRDYKSTDCPGDDLYALRAQLRKELGQALIASPPLAAPRFD